MSYGSGSHRSNCPWNRSTTNSYNSNEQMYQGIGNVSYPINKRPYSPENYSNNYQAHAINVKIRTLNGYVTKLYDTFGVIDNEVQFSFSACTKGIIPKQNDYVSCEATHTPGATYKWKAIKVQVSNPGRDYLNLKSITNSRIENDYKRGRGLVRSRDISRDRRHEEIDRKRYKRDDKEERIRETEKDFHRDREKPRDYDKSPVRRSRTPVKRRLIRYAVKVPTDLLTLSDADTVTLKKRYPALYIPSDFFTSSFLWCDTFPLTKPYTLNKPCNFHIMHKDCDSYVKNDAIYDPPDLDYIFSVKVMLMSIPHLDDIYKKTLCLAEDLHREDEKNYTHLTRLIQFLVGSRGKNEPLAIGGPWSPSLDGENPEKDPAVLIKTAIRNCKALTGIDLSACSQWYRFMEVYYHRSESVHKGKTIPARVETVVFFLPEVWNCVPSCLEWDSVILNYKNLLEEKLQPKTVDTGANQSFPCDQTEESDKEEDLVVIDKCEEKVEPTHYSELDPKNIKVNELRQELEARSLSTKGLKPQLIQRLILALKKERDQEEEESGVCTKVKFEEKEIESNDGVVKMDEEMKIVDELKVIDDIKEENGLNNDEDKSHISKTENQNKVEEIIDRSALEKRYAVPDTPHIIVHPSRSAKAGKFDCILMTLSNLLDYRANENKEHSFELFLFAELFYEMLQRDFGFLIYKALCEAPEKAKDEKDDKDKKKSEKDPTKPNSPDKNVKLEEKDEEEKIEKIGKEKSKKESVEKSETESTPTETKIENNEVKIDEIKKKEKIKMVTKDPYLLLSFSFFDRTHCGYIFDKDLESLIFCLGLQLSRHQTKKLIAKVAVRETIYYRKLTDKAETDEETPVVSIDVSDIALGNLKYLPVFSKNHSDTVSITPSTKRGRKNKTDPVVSKSTGMVSIGGAIVDIEKVTASLEKSETVRLDIEKQLLKCKKDNDMLRESLKRSTEKEKKINEDLRICRDKLMSANKEKISLMNKSRTYYKLIMNFKDQICLIEEKSDKTSSKNSKFNEKVDEKNICKNKKESTDDESVEKSDNEKGDMVISERDEKSDDKIIKEQINQETEEYNKCSEQNTELIQME